MAEQLAELNKSTNTDNIFTMENTSSVNYTTGNKGMSPITLSRGKYLLFAEYTHTVGQDVYCADFVAQSGTLNSYLRFMSLDNSGRNQYCCGFYVDVTSEQATIVPQLYWYESGTCTRQRIVATRQ